MPAAPDATDITTAIARAIPPPPTTTAIATAVVGGPQHQLRLLPLSLVPF